MRLSAQDKAFRVVDTLQKVDINRSAFSSLDSLPTPVQTLSGRQLEQLNSSSVADAVKYFSGVQVKDYGGIGGMKTINVRSLSANHTTLFYNGTAVNNAQNGQIDLGRFSLDNIGSISLFNGQQSNLLLPAKAFASASSLVLESKIPAFDPDKPYRLKATLRTGSFGLFNPSLLWQQKIARNIQMSLNVEKVKANGRYDFSYANGLKDTLINRKNSDISALRLEALFQGILNDSSQWNLGIYNYSSERGLPGAAVQNRYYSLERQSDDDFFVQGKWQKNFSDFYQLLFNSKYNRSKLDYLDPDFPSTAGYLNNIYKQQETYVSLANVFVWSPAFKSSLSADYYYSNLDANLVGFAYPERRTWLLNAALEWRLGRLVLQANGLATLASEKVENGSAAESIRRINPTVSASWRPFSNQNFYLRTFYKSIFRMPTFNDSYYTLVGSSTLRPEQVDQFDIGFTWQKSFPGRVEHLTFKTDGYHNRINDQITAVPLASLFRWTMVNIGQVDIKGLDLAVSGRIRTHEQGYADLAVNYTYQEAKDDSPASSNYEQYIPYAPNHSGSLSLSFALNEHLGFNYNTQYTGERYNSISNIQENLMDDWLLHHVSAFYQHHTSLFGYKLIAELNNFNNRNYTIIRNYPMPGRNFRLSLQITL